MKSVRLLVDSLADTGLLNAQMGNAREIISRLDPTGFHVSVFCAGDPDPRIAERPNIRVIKLPRRRQTIRILREFVAGDHRLLFYLKASPASRYYMKLRRAWDTRVTIGTVESQCDLHNEPTVSAENIKLWEKTVLRCDYLFSNSRSVQQSLKAEYRLPSEIVPTGVDTRFFCPAPNSQPNNRPVVLFVGSLRAFKHPDLMLDLAAKFPQADFLLVGEGQMAQELRERVQRENLTNARLLGTLAPEMLRGQYRGADLFVFPSTWEGSPKVILEAAACGLPVIVRNDYQPETVLDGVSGYLVSSDRQLFERTAELLSRPELRRQFGIAGRIHSQKFDWDRITLQWAEIFERLDSARKK